MNAFNKRSVGRSLLGFACRLAAILTLATNVPVMMSASAEFRIAPAERLIQIFARQQIPCTQDLAKKQFAIVYEDLNRATTPAKGPTP